MGTDFFGEIVRRAELLSIEPIVMFAKRGTSHQPSDEELKLDAECNFSVNDEGTAVHVIFSYSIDQESEDSSSFDEKFSASVAYELVYAFDPPLTAEHHEMLNTFAEHNGRFSSWPFLRAYLARVTSEFGLPAITLPLLKPYAPKPAGKGDEEL